MVRKIVITSGKGGVGKTTIVSALGVELAGMGYKVLMVDMDFGLNNLDIVMGIENKIVYDIIDVLEGRCQPRQAIVQDFDESNLYIFPSTHGFCRVKFGSRELLEIIKMVEDDYDFVLIDCPAGIDGGFKRAVECGGEHIVVTTPHLSAIRDADKVSTALMGYLGRRPGVIINRARGDLMVRKEMLGVASIEENLMGRLIGVVPDDDVVSVQMYKGISFDKNSQFGIAINMVAKGIVSNAPEIYDCTKRYRGVIGGLRKRIRGKV